MAVVLLLAAPPAPNYRAQEASRYALTAALWDRRSPRLDGYLLFSDYSTRDGHAYSDKAPGQPLAAVPVYAAWRALGGHPATEVRRRGDVGVWLVTLWCAVLPAAVLAVLMHRAARWVDERVAVPVALALATGTMLLPFSTLLFGHVLAGALAFGAFCAVVVVVRPLGPQRSPERVGAKPGWSRLRCAPARSPVRRRDQGPQLLAEGGAPTPPGAVRTAGQCRRAALGAGLLAGAAVAVEYPTAVVAVALGAYLLARAPRLLAWYGAGLVPPALVVAAYQVVAFGGPLTVPYRYHATFGAAHRRGLFGIEAPRLEQAVDVLVGPRGLLRLTPVVAVALAGLVLLAQRGRRAEAATVAAVVGAFALIPAGLANQAGDFAPGPRAVVPALPFLALPLAAAWARWPRVAAAAAVVGVATMVLATYSDPLLPPNVDALVAWAERAFDRRAVLDLPGRSAPWAALAALVATRLLVVHRRLRGLAAASP